MKTIKNLLKQALVRPVSVQINDSDATSHFLEKEYFSTPEALDMPFQSSNVPWHCKQVNSRAVTITVLKDVLYCPEYRILLTAGKRPIKESYNADRASSDFNLKYLFNREIEDIDETCLVFHHFDNNHFHAIVENIPRLYTACQHPLIYDSTDNISLIFSRPISEASKALTKPFLPSQVIPRDVELGRNYRLKQVVISSFPVYPGMGCLPTFYLNQLYRSIQPQRPRVRENRIYISRERAYNCRHVINEASLMTRLSHYGFKKYLLEEMSFEEQISLFYDAECVVAPHGAGLTNIVFSDKIKVIELFPEPYTFPHYYHLSKVCGHDYAYIMGQYSHTVSPIRKKKPRYAKDHNFTVNLDEVEQQLKSLERLVTQTSSSHS